MSAVDRPDHEPTKDQEAEDLLDAAWGVIANANNGNWDRSSPEWHLAACQWRDRYYRWLRVHVLSPGLVEGLSALTDEYGLAGVRSALERMESAHDRT